MFVVFLYCFPMLLFLRVCRKCLLHIKIKIKNNRENWSVVCVSLGVTRHVSRVSQVSLVAWTQQFSKRAVAPGNIELNIKCPHVA